MGGCGGRRRVERRAREGKLRLSRPPPEAAAGPPSSRFWALVPTASTRPLSLVTLA